MMRPDPRGTIRRAASRAHEEGAGGHHVDVHLPVAQRQLRHRGQADREPGAVDQHVDPPVLVHRAVEERRDLAPRR